MVDKERFPRGSFLCVALLKIRRRWHVARRFRGFSLLFPAFQTHTVGDFRKSWPPHTFSSPSGRCFCWETTRRTEAFLAFPPSRDGFHRISPTASAVSRVHGRASEKMSRKNQSKKVWRALGVGAVYVASLSGEGVAPVSAQVTLNPPITAANTDERPADDAPRVAAFPDADGASSRRNATRLEILDAEPRPPMVDADPDDPAPAEERLAPPMLDMALPDAVDEEPAAPEPVSEVAAAPQLTPELERLRDRMRPCLEYYSQRPETTAERSPWGVMHALIAYGPDTQVLVGNQRVNAIGWLLWNGNCRGQQLLYLHNNQLAAHVGAPGTQGHAGQLLAMLAQWRVRPETPMKVQGRDFTVADFIEYEKATCEPKSELTFKLIALSYYLDSDATWTDNRGRTWSIPRLIQEELAQPIVGAACGGTHRMTGFSYALRMRERDGKPLDGQWARARTFVDDYHEYTFRLQNADGSFSTNWFAGRGDWGDTARRIETTGHIFEWLAYSLPEEQLFDPRMVRAATFLTETMIQQRNNKIEIGPKGHALHGLNLYLNRAFKAKAEYITPEVARSRAAQQR